MELMLLVYLVQMIGIVGVSLILVGLLCVVLPQVKRFTLWMARSRVSDGRYKLLQPYNGLEEGKVYYLDMYGEYGYVKDNEYLRIRLSRTEIEKLFLPPATQQPPRISRAALLVLALGILLPNKETTIYMVGAYMVQEVVTSAEVKEVGSLALDATKAQLKAWASESPELASLLIQSGINEAKTVTKQVEADKP